MNISNGFLRLLLITYGLFTAVMVGAMFIYGYGRPDNVNWYLFLVLSAMLIAPLSQSELYGGDCTITSYWKRVNIGPIRTLILTIFYAAGATATGIWGIQYVSPHASTELVLFLMFVPMFSGCVGWITIKFVDFAFGGFKQ